MAERRAEIVADEAILKVTDEHTWGEAMAALLVEVKDGRPADGIVAAIERVGVVLAEHFPRSADDTNEIPDQLIELGTLKTCLRWRSCAKASSSAPCVAANGNMPAAPAISAPSSSLPSMMGR